MKVLVTGATGFLGGHLVERLVSRGDEVRALVRRNSDTSFLKTLNVEIVQGDVTQPGTLGPALQGVEAVYHTAAKVSDWAPWREFERTTIQGTSNVLKAAAAAGVSRFLHVSTDAVYALSALRGRITEDSPLERRFGFLDYYRRSKAAAERIARRYQRSGVMGVTILRPGLLLGERDRTIYPGAVEFLESSTAAYLGDGNNRLPYVYVGDVAEACILGVTQPQGAGRIYNVASDEPVTQRDLFDAVAAAAGLKPPRRSVPVRAAYLAAFVLEMWCLIEGRRRRPSMTRYGINLIALNYDEDCSRLRRELGWKPTVSLQEAVQRTADWIRQKGNAGGSSKGV